MQLFYSKDIIDSHFTLCEEESTHCMRVLRKVEGDEIDIIDGVGNLYHCTITECLKKSCSFQIDSIVSNFGTHPYNLHIAVAPTKNIDRIEWFLEKSTEIGINKITFLDCEHNERGVIKPERLEKVVVSAMKQSLKAYKPLLSQMIKFDDFVESVGSVPQKYIAHCADGIDKIHLKDIATKNPNEEIIVMIGPEGDFSTKEIKKALNIGFKPISLGDSRLRTETAALYSTAIISLL